MLCEALGYDGGARYVAFHWLPGGDELVWFDGSTSTTGNWWPWRVLLEHPLGRAILAPYDFGDSEREARHWLLADRWEGTLEVGEARDVDQLLATQPSELGAAARELGAEELMEHMRRHLEDRARRSPAETEVEDAGRARADRQAARLARRAAGRDRASTGRSIIGLSGSASRHPCATAIQPTVRFANGYGGHRAGEDRLQAGHSGLKAIR